MMKMLAKSMVAAIAIAAAVPVAAQDTPGPDTVVASINGTDITLAQMIMARASLPDQYQQLPNDVLWDGLLDQLIQQETLAQDDLAVETRRVRTALQNERRSLMAAEAINQIIERDLTDAAVQEAYDAQYAASEAGQEFNASHILVETQETAQELSDSANAGADFAELARENSTGPSGPNGGELGWFSAGMMVAPFQEAVEQMADGAVSDPVQTQFGWHVIKLNETRTKSAPPLEQVRAEIEGRLQQELITVYIDNALETATVTRMGKDEIDTTILSNTDILAD